MSFVFEKLSALISVINLRRTLERFPISLFMVWVLAATLVMLANNVEFLQIYIDLPEESLIWLLFTSGLVAINLELARERWQLSFSLPALGTILGCVALYYAIDWRIQSHHVVLTGGLFAAMWVSGFLSRVFDETSYWVWSLDSIFSAILIQIGAGIFFLGLLAISATLEILFAINANDLLLETIAPILFVGVFATFWLATLRPLKAHVSSEALFLQTPILIFTRYVALPLLVIYTCILYAYAIKILIEQSLPKGTLAVMVIAYALAGGVTMFLLRADPKKQASRVMQVVERFWYPASIVPAILLGLALWQRIDAYGITEERYMLAVLACLLTGIILLSLVAKGKPDLRVFAGGLAIVFVSASFGPWGMQAVSIQSQIGQFQKVLGEAGLVSDGYLKAIGKEPALLPTSQYQRLSNILSFLNARKAVDQLQPFLAKNNAKAFTVPNLTYKEAHKLFAEDPKSGGAKGTYTHYSRMRTNMYKINERQAWFGPELRTRNMVKPTMYGPYQLHVSDGKFIIEDLPRQVTLRIPLRELIERAAKSRVNDRKSLQPFNYETQKGYSLYIIPDWQQAMLKDPEDKGIWSVGFSFILTAPETIEIPESVTQ